MIVSSQSQRASAPHSSLWATHRFSFCRWPLAWWRRLWSTSRTSRTPFLPAVRACAAMMRPTTRRSCCPAHTLSVGHAWSAFSKRRPVALTVFGVPSVARASQCRAVGPLPSRPPSSSINFWIWWPPRGGTWCQNATTIPAKSCSSAKHATLYFAPPVPTVVTRTRAR